MDSVIGFIGNMYHTAHLVELRRVGSLLYSEVCYVVKFVKSNRSVNSTGIRFWKCCVYVLSLWSASSTVIVSELHLISRAECKTKSQYRDC
jgi:hypothetical protein